ncbi:hypothetical protein A0256_15630 [Mucilaginibacter sp. PAMC 26640]|nr:hypothetical protein A0256_15630 [Mucilaginibacter sp. PAMC 26640]
MKNSIKLTALFLLVSSGIFAATPARTETPKDEITLQSSAKDLVIDLSIQKETKGRSYVTFFDNENNELMTDYLSNNLSVNKNYNLSQLRYGTYTIAVTSNKQVVKKQVNVFEEYGKKTFVFLQ